MKAHRPASVRRYPRSQYCEVSIPMAGIEEVVPVDQLLARINQLARSESCRAWDIEQLRAGQNLIQLAILDEQYHDKLPRRRAGWLAAALLIGMAGLLVWCWWCEAGGAP